MQKFYVALITLVTVLIISSSSSNARSEDGIVIINGHPAREGYLLVRRTQEISGKAADVLHIRAQAKVVRRFESPRGLELVKINQGVSTASAQQVYEDDPSVLYAEPDYLVFASVLPNDSSFSQQWAHNNVGQTGGTANADINSVEAWDVETGSSDVVLAVIDTGVDYNHPDLVNNVWVNLDEIPGNGIDDDRNGYIDDIHGINVINHSGDPMDDNEHGTHVSGIIAAEGNNRIGVTGVMHKASIIGCKFLDANGSGATSWAIECLNYIAALSTRDNPVKVVASNNSWAGGPYSQALYDGIKSNLNLGILFMAAASNEGQNNDVVKTYPANFELPNIISVAATDHRDALASFSNYGRYSVHVAAPGVSILSTVPNGGYSAFSGTSMATPFVTGLAGLISSANPNLNWIQIKNLIIAGGQPISSANGKTISGRRIRAWDVAGVGSLTCQGQQVSSRLNPKKSTVDIRLGQSVPLSVLSIRCEGISIGASVKVNTNRAQIAAITLADDGRNGDLVAGDGIFTGAYTPDRIGTYQLKFSGNDIVTVRVRR